MLYVLVVWCVFTRGRKRERHFSSRQLYSKMYHVTSSNDNLCATLTKSNDCYQVTTTPGGFQLLLHIVLKWNNELEQIGGNFENKQSSALHAKINRGRGHLHMAFFRQTMFDLWRSWVVSMSERRTFPFSNHSAPHLIFMSTEPAAKTKVCLTVKCAFACISKSWSDFSCHYQLL